MNHEPTGRPPLDPAAFAPPPDPWTAVEVVEETGSTNADLAARVRDGAAEGLVVVAEHQTAGRGRLDRGWEAPPRASLTFSVLLAPAEVPTRRWGWLPLLTGLAVAEAVRDVTGVATRLKWPNDVLAGDRKLAGVLAERVDGPDGPAAVVGIGLNVSTTPDELPVPTATSLALAGSPQLDRAVLLRAVLAALGLRQLEWRAAGGDPRQGLRAAYLGLSATVGAVVRVDLPTGEHVEGVAAAVDDDGALVVRTAAGDVVVRAGDVVHLRPSEPPRSQPAGAGP